jgi:hypothetical protein
MSERVISDPTVAGWELNPDTGYWMWAAGGGSIQDGDTEGQITTWDGTEWTPEGAVVVDDNGTVITGENLAVQNKAGGVGAKSEIAFVNSDVVTGQSGRASIVVERVADASGGYDGSTITLSTTNGGVTADLNPAMTINADGNVNITGKLFINGEEVTAGGGGGGGFWVEESPGVIKYTGTAKATDLVAG